MKKTLLIIGTLFLFSNLIAQNEYSLKTTFGFTENKGQVYDQNFQPNKEVLYLLNLNNGLNIQLKANSFSYDTYTFEKTKKDVSKNDLLSDLPHDLLPDEHDFEFNFHRVDIEFLNASQSPKIIAEDPSVDFVNYYNAATPKSGANNIKTYGKITYKDVYPGIDVVFVADENAKSAFEYNFVVHPNADASQIKIKYNGAIETLLENEQIKITTSNGDFYENIPASWIDETKQSVQVNYFACEQNTFGFQVPEYSKSETLVIDPVPHLMWSTFFGGNDNDYINNLTLDNFNNIVACGITYSTNGIASSGSYQTSHQGDYDAFLAVFNSEGQLLFATYYGGDKEDRFFGCAVDADNNYIVVGRSKSASLISTVGSHQPTLGGASDAIVVKFNSAGERQWATYYGGLSSDLFYSIKTDSYNNIICGGYTYSDEGIATTGAFQTMRAGDADAFLVKFDPDGQVIWGTYYGGIGSELLFALTTDNNDDIYFTGNTHSEQGIATSNTHQPVLAGLSDCYIVKFDKNGNRLWGTYYGGDGREAARSIDVDNSNNLMVTGETLSFSGIATEGAHQTDLAGNYDCFLANFNTNDGTLQWGTYFGGSSVDYGYSAKFLSSEYIVLAGYTRSTTGISTPDAFQAIYGGAEFDGLIAYFDMNGQLKWSTYLGSALIDIIRSIAVIDEYKFVVAGFTKSLDFPVTAGVHQATFGGGEDDAFLTSFCIPPDTLSAIMGEQEICKGTYQTFTTQPTDFAQYYVWTLPSGVIGVSDSTSIEVFISDQAISGEISVYAVNSCSQSEPQALSITVKDLPETPVITLSGDILTSTPADTYQWYKDAIEVTGATSQTYEVSGFGEYYVRVTENGCLSEPSNLIAITDVSAVEQVLENFIIEIFPNPSEGYISVNLDEKIFGEWIVEVFSNQGKKVFANSYQHINSVLIDVSGFQKGIYVVRVVAGNEISTRKIIVQ
jgi:hypothetical protein